MLLITRTPWLSLGSILSDFVRVDMDKVWHYLKMLLITRTPWLSLSSILSDFVRVDMDKVWHYLKMLLITMALLPGFQKGRDIKAS
jgi:predicted cupin superfamily sugar epimerase